MRFVKCHCFIQGLLVTVYCKCSLRVLPKEFWSSWRCSVWNLKEISGICLKKIILQGGSFYLNISNPHSFTKGFVYILQIVRGIMRFYMKPGMHSDVKYVDALKWKPNWRVRWNLNAQPRAHVHHPSESLAQQLTESFGKEAPAWTPSTLFFCFLPKF